MKEENVIKLIGVLEKTDKLDINQILEWCKEIDEEILSAVFDSGFLENKNEIMDFFKSHEKKISPRAKHFFIIKMIEDGKFELDEALHFWEVVGKADDILCAIINTGKLSREDMFFMLGSAQDKDFIAEAIFQQLKKEK